MNTSPPPLPDFQSTRRESQGSRFLAGLTGILGSNLSSHTPSSKGTISSSLHVGKGRVLSGVALFGALCLSLLFLLNGGLAQAQESDTIEYPENGTGAVATLTAVDPEGESIVWSLADGDDSAVFDIEDGLLTFKSSPDFEDPKGGGANGEDNTYVVSVLASDGGEDTTATETLTIEVTNVEEPGTVMLSTLQPQVGVAIAATLTDPDNATATTATWQWYRGNSEIVGATNGPGTLMSSYTPTTGDVGSVLRATAMYDDGEDDDKTAQENSAHAVRQAPETNIPPSFPDQDLSDDGRSDRTDEESGGEHSCGHEYWRSRCSQ